MTWQRWNPAQAKSSIMRMSSVEERVEYRRKTWAEEWAHRLDEPGIREHVTTLASRRQAQGETGSCDSSREFQLLRSLTLTLTNLRRVFQQPLNPEPENVPVQVVSLVSPRRINLRLQPPLRQLLTTLGPRPWPKSLSPSSNDSSRSKSSKHGNSPRLSSR